MPNFLVTIAGSERHDGEKPYDYVAAGETGDEAAAKVVASFKADHDDDDVVIISVKEGLPGKNYPYPWNDIRSGKCVTKNS